MHDDQKLTAGDKVVQKMTRDGMVEQNLADKSTRRVSGRTQDAVLKKETEREETMESASVDRARKKRRAQRIRDADAVKEPAENGAEKDPAEASAQNLQLKSSRHFFRWKLHQRYLKPCF